MSIELDVNCLHRARQFPFSAGADAPSPLNDCFRLPLAHENVAVTHSNLNIG